MKKPALLLTIALLAGPLVALRAQEGVLTGDPAKGAAVLAEARKALGGAEKLAAVKSLQVKGKVRRTLGNNQLEGDLELTLQLPDKMKRVEDTSAPGGGPALVITQVLNGTEVWDDNSGGGGFGGFGRGGFGGGFGGGGRGGFGGGGGRPGGGAQPAGGDANAPAAGAPGAQGQGGGRGAIDPERLRQLQLRQRQDDFRRLLFGFLLESETPVQWVATAESPDGRADVLEVRPADGTPVRLFVDQTSHMPLMLTWQGAAPQVVRGGGRRGQPGQPGPPGGAGGPATPAQPAGPAAGAPPAAGGQASPDGSAPIVRRGGPPTPVTLQMTFADYKATGGVKFPQLVTRGIAGQTNEEWTLSSFKVNPALKADTFVKK